MKQTQGRWLAIGLAGAAAGLGFMLVRRQQLNRLALAWQVSDLTLDAVQQLGVRAESQFVAANGVQLHTVMAGPKDGKLVVLLHGFPECWYSWRRQIAALARAGYRVAAPDQRGYNLSDKPLDRRSYRVDQLTADICELVQALGHKQAIIVGHDWGGVAAWAFAMRYPHMVDKLVVMNAPHPAAFARELRSNPAQRLKSWYIAFFQLPWLPEALLGLAPMASTRLFLQRTAVRAGAFPEADLNVMASALAQPGALTAMLNWYRAAFERMSSPLRSQVIEAPTLLIWAENDVALGKSLTYDMADWVPNLRVHYIPHCGHWVQNEAPDEVNAQLLDFVK